MTKQKVNRIHRYFQVAFILLVTSAVIAGAIFYFNFNSMFAGDSEKVVLSNDMYKITGNPTQLQKDLFKELTTEVEKASKENEFEIVSLVVQNFIADYYTWSNKVGTYDIGGKDFIFANEFTNFNFTSRRYIYTTMSNFLAKEIAKKDLNEVSEIRVLSVNYATEYDYYGTMYPAYYIEAEWDYIPNELIDLTVFPKWGAFTVVKLESGRFEIVRFY